MLALFANCGDLAGLCLKNLVVL